MKEKSYLYNVEPSCEYCAKGTGKSACRKKAEQQGKPACKKFTYEPTLRKPPAPLTPKPAKAEDFLL